MDTNNPTTPQATSTEIFSAPEQPGAPPPPAQPPVTPPPPPGGAVPPGSPPVNQTAIQPPVPPQFPIFSGKKKILFIILGVIILVLIILLAVRMLSASSNDEEKAELTYWGIYEDPKVMQVLIDEFQRENPHITVNFVQQDPEQYRDRLMTRIRNGNGPDIFRYHNGWVPMLTGVLLPLSADAVSPEDFEKSYYKVIRDDLVYNGGILGIPLVIDTLAMFTNDQMLATQRLKPPVEWNEFISATADLTTRVETGDNKGEITTAGTALGTYDNITHASDIISLFMVQNGVNLYDITAATSEKELNGCNYKACEALSFYTIFAKGDGNIQKVWDGTMDNSVVSFANGRVGMYFGYSWDIFTIKSINPNLQFSIHPVPNLQGQKKAIASYWVEGVSNKTLYPEASMKFMKFLHQKETQQMYYTEKAKVLQYGRPYARVDLGETLKDDPLLYPFVQQASYAVSTPFVSDTQDNGLNAIMNGYLKNAVLEISGNTSEKTAVETLNQGVIQTMQRYVR